MKNSESKPLSQEENQAPNSGMSLVELEERLEMAAVVFGGGAEELGGDTYRCCSKCKVE